MLYLLNSLKTLTQFLQYPLKLATLTSLPNNKKTTVSHCYQYASYVLRALSCMLVRYVHFMILIVSLLALPLSCTECGMQLWQVGDLLCLLWLRIKD